MKAAVLRGPQELCMEERPIPVPGAGEILLKVHSAAICGTDIRMWRNAESGCAPLVLGHEMAGVIEQLGKGVEGYQEGQAVAVMPNMGCGLCDSCVSGNTHMCPQYRALGIHLDGAFAEYVLIPAAAVRQGNVCVLASGSDFDQAAAAEALSCVYNAFEGYCPHPGDTVLIIGAGPIGIMHAKLALMAGAAQVILNDLSQERLSLCQRIEPRILPYWGNDLKGFIAERTSGRGVDVCITACPSPAAQASALDLMALRGRVCFFGGLPKGKELVPLNTNLVHYRQLILTGSSRASLAQYRKCLALIASGLVDLSQVVTNRYPIDEIQNAFAYVAAAGGLKSVIRFA